MHRGDAAGSQPVDDGALGDEQTSPQDLRVDRLRQVVRGAGIEHREQVVGFVAPRDQEDEDIVAIAARGHDAVPEGGRALCELTRVEVVLAVGVDEVAVVAGLDAAGGVADRKSVV